MAKKPPGNIDQNQLPKLQSSHEKPRSFFCHFLTGGLALLGLIFTVFGWGVFQNYQELYQESVTLGVAIQTVDSSCSFGETYSGAWAWDKFNSLTDCQAHLHRDEFNKRKPFFKRLSWLNFFPVWKGQKDLAKRLEQDTHGKLFDEAYAIATVTSEAFKSNIAVTAISGALFAQLMHEKGIDKAQWATAALATVRQTTSGNGEMALPKRYLESLKNVDGIQARDATGFGYLPTEELSEVQISDLIENLKSQSKRSRKIE